MNIYGNKFEMRNFKLPRKGDEQGSTLVIMLVLMVTMVAIAIGALKVTQLNVETAGAHTKGKKTFYAAEVGLDQGVNDIITEFENLSLYTTTAAKGGSPGISSTYNDHTVTYNITNPLDRYLYKTVVGKGTIFHYAHTYNIEAEAVSNNDNSRESLNESIRILETPLVQYFAFYGGQGDLADLELYPGADMNIWGRMHANRNMYIVGRNNIISIRNYDTSNSFSPHFVSMAGVFKGKQKHKSSYESDTDTFVRKTDNTTLHPDPTVVPAEFKEIPLDVNSSNETTIEPQFNDFFHVLEKSYQAPGKTQFWRNGFYDDRSENPQNPRIDSIKIVSDPTNGIPIQVWVSRPTLTEVTPQILAGFMPTGAPAITPPIREWSGTNTLYDRREGKYVDFTDIDLYLIGEWYNDYLANEGLTKAGDGMLIYTSRSPDIDPPAAFANNGTRLQAIRLIQMGGSPASLDYNTTVATDNPIYIQGNFNNSGTRRGVALVSDATNILSDVFTSKTNSGSSAGWPTASTTTVNAAFFSGIKPNVENSGTRVGGGLHNYPRMHENWGNANTLNISGSFISLWESTQAVGDWCHGTSSRCYLRPERNYGWDVNFEDPNFWPPFIPSIFSVERVGFLE